MPTNSERQALVVNFIPLAHSLAWKKFKNTPRHISFDELKSAAYMGLVDAASRYDPIKYPQFQPHSRIQGEMEDYLRSIQWGKRGQPVDTVCHDDVQCENLFTHLVDHKCESDNFIDKITEPLDSISKNIVIMYDIEDKNLKEIGSKFQLSPSRVHQLLHKSHAVLQKSWNAEKLFLEVAA